MIGALRRNQKVRGFIQVLGGNALASVSQALQFVLLARALGPGEFGKIAAVAGVTQVLFPFSGLGFANVMVMRASRDPSVMGLYLGNTLFMTLATGVALVGLAASTVEALLRDQVAFSLMAVWAVSELICSRAVDICWQTFLARDQLRITSAFLTMQSISRLCAAGLFVRITQTPSAQTWVWWALLSNLIVASTTLWITIKHVGRLKLDIPLAFREFGVAISFAVGQSAKSFYTDADKVFLARYASAEVVGHYTVAYRIVQIALTVIRALSMALQNQMFRVGEAGLPSSFRLTLRVLRPTAICALVLGGGFYVFAPLLTVIAGSEYEASVPVLRALCMIPFVLAVQILLYDTLSTSGHQHVAAVIQIVSAGVIWAVSVMFIPTAGWVGAVAASYSSQITLCILFLLAIVLEHRKFRSTAAAPMS